MEKVGKTTFGSRLPRSLFCNFEVGTNFLPGVMAVNVSKWTDFKHVLRQLEKPEVRAKYDNVVIDTIGVAYSLCEDFVCQQNGVQKIGDLAYGAGYKLWTKEFEDSLRKITMMGYGLLIIAHEQKKSVAIDENTIIEKISPAIPPRGAEVVNRIVDLILYIEKAWDGQKFVRTFITRGTPSIMAGSRLPYLAERIDFSYDSMIAAIDGAIDEQVEKDGAIVVNNVAPTEIAASRSFKEVQDEARQLWVDLIAEDEDNKDRILKKIEIVFGRKLKMSEITEDQIDLFELAIADIKTLL